MLFIMKLSSEISNKSVNKFKLVLFTLQNFLPQHLQRTIVMDYFYQEIK